MGELKFKFTGLKELEAAFKNAYTQVSDSKRVAVAKGAAIVLDEMKRLAPEYHGPERQDIPSGFMRDHLNVRFGRDKDSNEIVAYIGPSTKDDYPKSSGKLYKKFSKRLGKAAGSIGVYAVARFLEFGTRHAPAHPFLRPAFTATVERAKAAIAQVLRDALAQVRGK